MKVIKSLIFGMTFLLGIGACFSFETTPDPREIPILNNSSDTIIQKDLGTFREGSYDAIHSTDSKYQINNLIGTESKIESQADATKSTLSLVQRVVNFALGFVSVIALVLLLIAGFKMTTAAGDDKSFGSGKEKLITIAKAIAGIALSWMVISFIFWLLDILIS